MPLRFLAYAGLQSGTPSESLSAFQALFPAKLSSTQVIHLPDLVRHSSRAPAQPAHPPSFSERPCLWPQALPGSELHLFIFLCSCLRIRLCHQPERWSIFSCSDSDQLSVSCPEFSSQCRTECRPSSAPKADRRLPQCSSGDRVLPRVIHRSSSPSAVSQLRPQLPHPAQVRLLPSAGASASPSGALVVRHRVVRNRMCAQCLPRGAFRLYGIHGGSGC
jgi:hypothetical protein